MSITKSIVDLMGGAIDVLTAPGAGTTIIIRIKFRLAEEKDVRSLMNKADETEATKTETTSEMNFTGKRLLLVEDNAINMEIASMILSQAGFTVETAENGQIAVNMVTCRVDSSTLLSSISTREGMSLPLTEPDVRFFRIRLFKQSLVASSRCQP